MGERQLFVRRVQPLSVYLDISFPMDIQDRHFHQSFQGQPLPPASAFLGVAPSMCGNTRPPQSTRQTCTSPTPPFRFAIEGPNAGVIKRIESGHFLARYLRLLDVRSGIRLRLSSYTRCTFRIIEHRPLCPRICLEDELPNPFTSSFSFTHGISFYDNLLQHEYEHREYMSYRHQ